jgi:hypothetical protein
MTSSLLPAAQRALSGVIPPDGTTAADPVEAAAQLLAQEVAGQEVLALAAGGRFAASPHAFVAFAGIVFAFVFGLLAITRLHPAQVLQIAGGTTGISVAGFFGRNAVVIIGRRLITGPGKQ